MEEAFGLPEAAEADWTWPENKVQKHSPNRGHPLDARRRQCTGLSCCPHLCPQDEDKKLLQKLCAGVAGALYGPVIAGLANPPTMTHAAGSS